MTSRVTWQRLFAILASLIWLAAAGTILVVGSLMSLDEEWNGWTDILFNQYIIVPFLLLSILTLASWYSVARNR